MLKKYKLSAAAITAILLGGGLYFYEPSAPSETEPTKKTQETKPVQGFGVIDLERIKNKHPDGEELKKLIRREKRLKLELDAAMTPYKPPQHQPEFEEKPFEESAREKNMQQIIEKMSALKAKKTRLLEEFTADSREEYLRRRNAVREVYLNAALNVTLKLQNADNLRLKPDEIQKLQDELEQITKDRNEQQKKMLDEWTAEINARVEQATAEEERQAREEIKKLRAQSTSEAEQKVQAVQTRNRELTEKTIQEIESRQKRRRVIFAELQEVEKQRNELENKILDSITEEIGKLGAIYKVEMIFVKDTQTFDKKFFTPLSEMNFDFKQKKNFGGVVYFNKNVTDLTKDLIKEMELKGVKTE